MAPDPGQPLLCHFTKVPSGYRRRRSAAEETISSEALPVRAKEILACAVIKWYLMYSLHLNMNGAGLLDTSLKLVHASEHFCGPRGFVATKY